jgi:uncharacterized protein YegL
MPVYDESASPRPLAIFLTSGENTGPGIEPAAARLQSVQFKNGSIRVIACGMGMRPEHLGVLKQIASTQEDAPNIDPSRLVGLIASLSSTLKRIENAF